MTTLQATNRVLLISALALGANEAAGARPEIDARSAQAVGVELLAPRGGMVLSGATTARLAWTASRPLPPDADEWEGFLSLDGGNSYRFRITPHLDLGRREFVFTVPNVSSDDVRLLLRFGNERQEIAVEFPDRLAIVAAPELLVGAAGSPAAAAGEVARATDREGVHFWVDGSRHGTNLKQWHVTTPGALRGAADWELFAHGVEARLGSRAPTAAPSQTDISRTAPQLRCRPTRRRQFLPLDLGARLARWCRRNE